MCEPNVFKCSVHLIRISSLINLEIFTQSGSISFEMGFNAFFLSHSDMSCLASSERCGIAFGLLHAGMYFLLILSRVFLKNIFPWCAFAGLSHF